jgi:hypothetical protein
MKIIVTIYCAFFCFFNFGENITRGVSQRVVVDLRRKTPLNLLAEASSATSLASLST